MTPHDLRKRRVGPMLLILSLCLVIFLFVATGVGRVQDDIIIQSYLFRGFHDGLNPGPKFDATVSSKPLVLRVRPEDFASDQGAIAFLKEEIGSVFHISDVVFLTSGRMTWNGRQENLNEIVLNELDIYPIQLYPRSLTKDALSMKLEAYKFQVDMISHCDSDSGGGFL